jgi:hypothetical protein
MPSLEQVLSEIDADLAEKQREAQATATRSFINTDRAFYNGRRDAYLKARQLITVVRNITKEPQDA